MKTLQTYLGENFERGIIDHSLRANVSETGEVTFYIHPDGRDGETLDFSSRENDLAPVPLVQSA